MVTLKWSLVFDKMSSLLHGCAVTMEISILTLIFGTVLGVVLALMRDSRVKIVARIAQLYSNHAIDPGQREAAKALGMPWHLEMLRIVAPQATKICILPLVNQFIATIKNTSILSAITLTELTREGTLIAYNSFHYFEPYIAVAVLYLILTTIFTQLAGVLERRMA